MNDKNNAINSQASKDARANANNANMVSNAAKVAQKSGHPVAATIGKAVDVGDKVTGGKISQAGGKALTALNKNAGLKGKALQAASNKLAESGTANRIGEAASKGNGLSNSKSNPADAKTQAPKTKGNMLQDMQSSSDSNMRETQEQASDGGDASFKVSFKVLRNGLIVCAICFPIIVFCNLFISASQVQLKATGLGNADALNSQDAEEKINKKLTEDEESLEEEATDEDIEESDEEDTKEVSFNFLINENTKNINQIKLKESNLVLTAKVRNRKYNESDLENLEDFYPSVSSLSKQYDEDLVYDFFFKMYNIYITYRDEYGVYLDLPLIMSTLMVQSDDMNEVFYSNLTEDEKAKEPLSEGEKKELYSYDTDLSWYLLSPDKSEHDMELLAQNMVSATSGDEDSSCENTPIDGVCYQIDEKKYKEFLKEFLERKYFVEDTGPDDSSCPTETPFEKYDLTDEQIQEIAKLAYHEQNTPRGAATIVSFMANMFELKGKKYGEGAEGLYNCIKNSGWFTNLENVNDTKKIPDKIIDVVKNVLVDGKRTLPGYIDQVDIYEDIKSAENEDGKISLEDRDLYEKHEIKLKNKEDVEYTFYSFLSSTSNVIYGYTSDDKREEIGDIYYNFTTGKPRDCSQLSDGNYVGDVEFMTGGVGKIYYYNQLDYSGSPYGSYGTIASHGCGPTSLAIAISSLLKEAHDPIELTKHICDRGGCTNAGTAWANMTSTPKDYGLKAVNTGDKQAVINALSKGNSIAVVIMCQGHFTTGGHYIALTGVNKNGQVTVADPASRERSKDWDYNIVVEEACPAGGNPFWIVSK